MTVTLPAANIRISLWGRQSYLQPPFRRLLHYTSMPQQWDDGKSQSHEARRHFETPAPPRPPRVRAPAGPDLSLATARYLARRAVFRMRSAFHARAGEAARRLAEHGAVRL